MLKQDLRAWIDLGLLFFFPATFVTGYFHGPGRFPCYWHGGMSFFLLLFTIAHVLVNEQGLRNALFRVKKLLLQNPVEED